MGATGGEGNTGNLGSAGGGVADRAIRWTDSCAFADDRDSNEVDFGGTFTVELWFQPHGSIEGNRILLYNGGSNATVGGYSVETAGDDIGFCGSDGVTSACAWYDDILETDGLYHIAGVYDPMGYGTVFVWSAQTPSPEHQPGTPAPLPMPDMAAGNTQRFAIGGPPMASAAGCEPDYRAHGTIDDVRIRHDVLGKGALDDELAADCLGAELEAFWRFDEPDRNADSVDCKSSIALKPQTFENEGWERVDSPFAPLK